MNAHASVTVRGISGITGRVQRCGRYQERALQDPVVEVTRFDGISTRRFTKEMDDFDDRGADALALSEALLAEADAANDDMCRLLDSRAG